MTTGFVKKTVLTFLLLICFVWIQTKHKHASKVHLTHLTGSHGLWGMVGKMAGTAARARAMRRLPSINSHC